MIMSYYERPLPVAGAAPAQMAAGINIPPTWAISFGEAQVTNLHEYAFLGTPVTGHVPGGTPCNAPGIPLFVKSIPATLLYEGAPAGIPAPILAGQPATSNDWQFDLFRYRTRLLAGVTFR